VLRVAVTLLQRQIDKVERWQAAREGANFSSALREIIDAAPEPRARGT
jgi:hypothetical protein